MALFGNDGGGAWSYYIEITAQNAQVDAAIDDVYVDLSNLPADFFSNVQDGGADIRVTDSSGDTELAREVVSCDTTASTGELHFDAGGLLSTSSDTTYRIYYGNASATDYAATDTYGRNNVWGSNTASAFHLGESSGDAIDSTGKANLTYNGALPTQITGQIGHAQDWVASSDDYADNSTPSYDFSGGFTYMMLGKLSDTSNHQRLMETGGQNNNALLLSPTGSGYGDIPAKSLGIFYSSNSNEAHISWDDAWDNTWKLFIVTVDASNNVSIYVDGTSQSVSDVLGSIATSPTGITIGASNNFSTAQSYHADGSLDETRIIETDISANDAGTYSNLLMSNSNFWSVGTQTTIGYTISGTVTDDGSTVSGAEVAVIYADDDQMTNAVLLEVTQTDASGNWSADIPSGKTAFATAFHKDASSNLHVSTGHGYITEGA